MTDAEKKMKQYTNAVERKLNLPRDVRNRVMNDFLSAIQSRRDAGMTDGEIYMDLGTPREVAADLNAQMKEFAYKKSPWRWLCLGLSGLCLLRLLPMGRILWAISLPVNQSSVDIIGGADGPTAIFVTRSPASVVQTLTVTGILLVMGLLGFWYLGHMRKK